MCPIYEFKCEKCDNLFSSVQKMEDPAPVCDNCGAPTYKQVSAYGGYHMNSGPSSIRPKGAGSFKVKRSK
jgi:putative FmdB family regulatory protein